ncbi:ParB/RepB/Spo0J family partition protein [Pelotomaculum isophthalicicum JI]|uniref:ParB/RepB/Spo0J family partition protein n=1 Tax=Pelotomaculum isophthalicicum JI TaxID=947010 RepID=A0A9X4H351_9FIRM|nr:ParB/RepB/Spo0J family partition protein [Pelotomaculum isophthalicicum]MDF9407758.1 ParB/RepB/Spo0J family partition protein [Pelotomaculum isophthalicicum JI]
MSKRRGLGKGLEALIPSIESTIKGQKEIQEEYKEINIEDIKPAPNQARQLFDQEKLTELAASIKEHGVIQPVVVRPLKEDGYELIAGERRWRACKILGYKLVPAIIKKYEDLEAIAVSLIENVQREDLNPLEEATAYQQLIKKYGLTQDEVSGRVGKSRPFVANMVRLLDLPSEIKDMLADGQLNAGHARALLAIREPGKQLAAARKISKQQLSVRQAEKMTKNINETGKKVLNDRVVIKDFVQEIEAALKNYFETTVKLKENDGGGGRLEINYRSKDELKRIIEMMLGKENVSRETFSDTGNKIT